MGIDYTPPNTSAAGITQLTGDVTAGPGSGSQAATIGAGKVTEAMQVLANNTTQNVSTTKHGYAPLLPNDATKYLDGTGNYTVPAGSGGGSVTNVATGSYLTGGPITTTGTIDASTGTIGILEAAQQKLLGGI